MCGIVHGHGVANIAFANRTVSNKIRISPLRKSNNLHLRLLKIYYYNKYDFWTNSYRP